MIQGNTKSKIHLGAINGVFWRVLWKSKPSDKTGEYWREWEESMFRQQAVLLLNRNYSKSSIRDRIIKRFMTCIR